MKNIITAALVIMLVLVILMVLVVVSNAQAGSHGATVTRSIGIAPDGLQCP